MQEALISVIVPVYKVEKYLKPCVDSILNQTYKNLEIILVDDGSPDNCPKICDEFIEKDNRIKVIHKENGGLSDARNAGIDIATGEYLAFVDSDDYIDSCMYERLLEKLIENNADVAMCYAKNIYDDDCDFYDVEQKEIDIYDSNDIFKALFKKELNNFAWNKLYKKSLFSEIRYPKGKIYEDLFTTYRIFGLCERAVLDRTQMYYYRVRSESIMGKARKVINTHKFLAFNEIIAYFNETPEILKLAKDYMTNDLMSDVFKVISADTIDKNKEFFEALKVFLKTNSFEKNKSTTVLNISVKALWILKVRFFVRKMLGRIR